MATLAPWQATYEPKREHKFMLELNNIKAYFIQDVIIPKATISDTAAHNFLSHKFKFPGKLTWDDSTFTLADPIDLNAAALLVKHIRSMGYVFPSSFNFNDPTNENYYLRTIKKAGPADNAINVLDGLKIISLDADGNTVEKWLLKNAFIKSVDFGSYKYEGDGALKNVKVVVSVDWVDYEGYIPNKFTTAPSST